MKKLFTSLVFLLAISTSFAADGSKADFAKGTYEVTLEVYHLSSADRIAIGDIPALKLMAAFKSKSAKLLHRGVLSAVSAGRCVYQNGTTIKVLDDWERNKDGRMIPVFTEHFLGITAEIEISHIEGNRIALVTYSVKNTEKPAPSRRGGVTMKDGGDAMEFNYEIPAFPEMNANGQFVCDASNGSRVIYETLDQTGDTVFFLSYKLELPAENRKQNLDR